MGTTTVTVQVCRVDDPNNCREVKDVVVDTGAWVSAFPESILKSLGIDLPLEREFTLADESKVRKKVGGALLKLDDRSTTDDIIAVPEGARSLLGVRALEGLALRVDPRTGRLEKEDASLLL